MARRAVKPVCAVAEPAAFVSNTAQYLVDLHDQRATVNFCGGRMFQLVLTDKLRDHLARVAESGGAVPVVHDASTPRMFLVPGYTKSADADNVVTFHGREVRQVPTAAGGMNFVLQLSHTEDDPEGWTKEEVADYAGWLPDSSRTWRNADDLAKEGVEAYRTKFGEKAFGLHHRFYLHLDRQNKLWLSAEDGCEGTPADGPGLPPNPAAFLKQVVGKFL